jgi:hypothetical protein
MTTISLVTTDQLLAVAMKPKVASGDVESTRLHVDFDSHWEPYGNRTAVFFTSYSNAVYEVMLASGECVIPYEVLTKAGTLYIGVRGTNTDAAVKTSTLVKYKIEEGAPAGGTSKPPTPDVYQQILDIMANAEDCAETAAEAAETAAKAAESAEQSAQDAEAIAQSVRNDADAGAFDGKDGEDGITPHIGANKNWWIGNTDTGIKAEGTVDAEHKHTISDITDFPTEMTPTAHNQAASTITAGTFAGQVVANSGAQTPGTALLRNSKIVSADITPSNNGEICWTYK